jgi:rhodanese-related sulfurtransferase
MIKNISANELAKLLASGKTIELIDVRTPIEFRSMHITIARNVPLNQLDPMAIQAARNGSSTEPLYMVCRSGGRSRMACEKLIAAGITNVVNVEGGTMACAAAGIPIAKGKKAVPISCQVQIITGLAVFVGAAIAMVTGNLYWLSLPMLMGAGLVFSGVTNTCVMGTVLACMPWNQIKPETATAAESTPSNCCTETATGCCN